MSSVILLEFNELTPHLMDRFIAEGHLPAFKRLRDESLVCKTDAGEKPPYLEPWIQWVTVHTGLAYQEHKVFTLSDGPKLRKKRIWDMVSDAGHPVWVCGSMNAAVAGGGIRGMVLPDPWATDVTPIPEKLLTPYSKLVSSYVQEYTRDKPPLSRRDYLQFSRFMLANGLSLQTIVDAMRQLAGEKGAQGRWKRASILDRLQWDVFKHFYKKLKPKLSTFFINSTAHYQHYYWRNLDPKAFEVKPTHDSQAEFQDAILFGYKQMDALIANALDLAGTDTAIVLCTALSQQPLTKYDAAGGMQLFKPINFAELAAFLNLDVPCRFSPVMAEDFKLWFESEADAMTAESGLLSLTMSDGSPVMKVTRTGNEIYAGCAVITPPAPEAQMSDRRSGRSADFARYFYLVETGLKSGMHHPLGMLWIRAPGMATGHVERLVSLQEIAPTMLSLIGVKPDVRFSHPPLAELHAVPRRSVAA